MAQRVAKGMTAQMTSRGTNGHTQDRARTQNPLPLLPRVPVCAVTPNAIMNVSEAGLKSRVKAKERLVAKA
jgi:hypothetical protein